MIIVHCASFENRIFLWGEKPAEKNTLSHKQPRLKLNRAGQKMYPYDAGADVLPEALEASSVSFRLLSNKAHLLCVWLPTIADKPIPSSVLVADAPKSSAKTKLAAWGVSAYPVSINEAVELLCLCMAKQNLSAGVVIGDDLAFWAEALRFGGSLVARQQYLPGLAVTEGKYHAQWEPVFAGNDAERLTRLVNRIPPVALAFSDVKAKAPPKITTVAALKSFITAAIDYLVRAVFVEGHPSARKRTSKRAEFDSVHDAWLYALRSEDGVVEYGKSALAQLAEQVRQWHQPIAISTTSAIRFCFRLEEPEGINQATLRGKQTQSEKEKWYVRYLLQPHNDPSLLVPVGDAWVPKGRKTSALKSLCGNIQEYLLSSLGQAAGICPNIAASLKVARPAGYEIDTIAAHQFLTEKAILLQQAGFGVMLPAWWTRKGTKLRLAAKASVSSPKMQGGSGLSLNEMVQFDLELALGEEKITIEELMELARLKSPLLRARGQWVEINAEEIQAAMDFWNKKASSRVRVRDIIQMALGARTAGGGLEFVGVRAIGWIGELLEKLEGRTTFEELAVPESFAGTLRPYQVRGYSWLAFLKQWGLGACLADDMGLGKTIQALALIQRDWHSNGRRPVLLVCPTSVVNNWQKEASRFTPELPVMVHHGSDRKKQEAFKK